MKIYIFLTALTCLWSAANSRKVVWTLPLDQAKVIYHHQKICLTVKGVENCIKKDKEPGDPQELAKMFSIVHEYESGGDGGDGDGDGDTGASAGAGADSVEVESLHDDPDNGTPNHDEVDERMIDDAKSTDDDDHTGGFEGADNPEESPMENNDETDEPEKEQP